MADEFLVTTVSLENVPFEGTLVRPKNIRPKDTQGPQTRILIVPIAWAAIAVAIAVHVVEHALDKLIDQWFGEKSDADLQGLLQDFIQAIAVVVRQQFDEHDLRLMAEDAASAQSWFRMYHNSKDKNEQKWYLNQAHHFAHNLTFHAAPFTYRAVSTFAVAGGLELAALHEKAKHDSGGKKNLVMRADELLGASSGFKSSLEKYNRSRFGELHMWGHRAAGWWYELDHNNRVRAPGGHEDAVAFREKHIASEFASLEKQLLVPFYEVREKWGVIAKG
jgi:hypothetical protein